MYFCVLMPLIVGSEKIVEYRFGFNYGQVFVDYSNHNNHGVNGDSHLTTSKDTFLTDRGAYFNGGINLITIPQNSLVLADKVLSNPFTILCWYHSLGSDGELFNRFKLDDYSNNYISISSSSEKIILEVNDKGNYNYAEGESGSFLKNQWKMISIVVTGSLIKGYSDDIEQVSIMTLGNYIEVGTYLMTIGSNSLSSVKGFIWYFAILDNDEFGQSSYISQSVSVNCFTSTCNFCNPSIMDSYLGKGCVSDNQNPNQDANGNSCSYLDYGCSPLGNLNCSACPCGSCAQLRDENVCLCYIGCNEICNCQLSNGVNWDYCCDSSCFTCYSNSTTSCASCIAENSLPDLSTGCICNTGYYNDSSLNLVDSCKQCNEDCANCTQSDVCTSCKSSNAYPDSNSGCICDPGYYNDSSLNLVDSCKQCNEDCASCVDSNLCISCKSLNAEPNQNLGCNCNFGYYGTKPLNSSDSCTYCNETCEVCINSQCTSCVDGNSTVVGSGCECISGFYRSQQLTNPYTCYLCHSDCFNCTHDLICEVCKDPNSSPSDIQGCICNSGYYQDPNSLVTNCLKCDSQCLECNSLNYCLNCVALNTYIIDGNCYCKEGYFNKSGLEYIDGCGMCTDFCLKCTDSFYFRCLDCEYWLVDGVCFRLSPLGYVCNNRVCRNETGAYLSFNFKSVGTIYYDDVNNIAGTCCENNTGDTWDVVTASDRGVYMYGTGGIKVIIDTELTLLGTQFAISTWINPYIGDFILSELGPSSNPSLKLVFSSYTAEIVVLIYDTSLSTASSLPIIANNWNHLLVVLEYTNELSTLTIYINGVQDLNITTLTMPIHIDTNEIFYIGSNSSSQSSFKGFIYAYELYVIKPDIDLIVVYPGDDCIIHPKDFGCIPLCNISQFEINKTCENCSPDCKSGCKNASTCSLCADEYCEACGSLELFSCTKCENNVQIYNSSCAYCEPYYYYEVSSQSCFHCQSLCEECYSALSCNKCKENTFYSNGECICLQGYNFVNNECLLDTFYLIIYTKLSNQLKLEFSKALLTLVDESSINLIALNLKSYEIINISRFTLIINLKFSGIVKRDSKAKIIFTKNIESIDHDILSPKEYMVNLFETDEAYQLEVMESKINAAKEDAKLGTFIGISVAGATSLINGDLSSIFTFLNTAEMFYAVLFFDIELYSSLSAFLFEIRMQSKFPNIFKLIFTEQNGIMLSEKNKDYGFKTNLIFINCGVQFTFLIVFAVIWMFIRGLSFINKIKAVINPVLLHFEYSVFLRIWVQSYFDILHACRLGIIHSSFENALQIANFTISIIIIALQIIAFILLLKSIWKLSKKHEAEAENYRKAFGTFFEDFKEKGPEMHLYYALFIIRRILLVISSQFGADKLIQIIIAIVLALTNCVYVISTKCFKSIYLNIMNVVLDFLVAVFYLVILFKYLPESTSSWKVISAKCISILICGWGVHIGLSGLTTIMKIKNKISEMCKKKVSPIVEPVKSNSIPAADKVSNKKNIHFPKNILTTT